MNKKIVFGILGVIFITLIVMWRAKVNDIEKNEKILKKYEVNEHSLLEVNKNSLPKKGIVEDKETAIKIAEKVFEQIYKKSIDDKKPFDVKYDDEYNVWVVKGTLKTKDIAGVPNIIIKKSDSKIIAVWSTRNGEGYESIIKKYEINKNSLVKASKNVLLKEGIVEDKETAIKIAETAFKEIYTMSKDEVESFDVRYDDEYNVWVVKGVLRASEIGWIPNIIIRKIDGKVIAVWKIWTKDGEKNEIVLQKYEAGGNKDTLEEVNKNIKEGIVEDKEAAIKIAEKVFQQVFEKSTTDNKPYDVDYDDECNVWVVKGTLKPVDADTFIVGGVPNIIIRKSDSKIIALWHTK